MKPTSSFHSNHDIPNVQQDKQPCINAQVNTKINSQSRWIYPKCEGNILIYIYTYVIYVHIKIKSLNPHHVPIAFSFYPFLSPEKKLIHSMGI